MSGINKVGFNHNNPAAGSSLTISKIASRSMLDKLKKLGIDWHPTIFVLYSDHQGVNVKINRSSLQSKDLDMYHSQEIIGFIDSGNLKNTFRIAGNPSLELLPLDITGISYCY